MAHQLLSLAVLAAAILTTADATVFVRGICPMKTPKLATKGDSCGVPDFVDKAVFGDNMDTTGVMAIQPTKKGLNLRIRLKNLPMHNLVLTAWLIYVPFGRTTPDIFKVANHAAPCARTTARYSTGIGEEPNQLRYHRKYSAKLSARLNFNPTHPDEAPLTREAFNFQKDVPGIQETMLKQYKTPGGVYIPTSSSYLRKYEPTTGFEMLDKRGHAMLARSPIAAMGVEVIAHVDRTTHGISQGVGNVDHYMIMFFPFPGRVGKKTMPM